MHQDARYNARCLIVSEVQISRAFLLTRPSLCAQYEHIIRNQRASIYLWGSTCIIWYITSEKELVDIGRLEHNARPPMCREDDMRVHQFDPYKITGTQPMEMRPP